MGNWDWEEAHWVRCLLHKPKNLNSDAVACINNPNAGGRGDNDRRTLGDCWLASLGNQLQVQWKPLHQKVVAR